MSSDVPVGGDAENGDPADSDPSNPDAAASGFDATEYDPDFDPENPESCEGDAAKSDDFAASASACAYTDYSPGGKNPDDLPATGEGAEGVEARIWDALYDVEDPEMPVSVVDLGLIYGAEVDSDGRADVEMTLTYTGCPARDMLTDEIEAAVAGVEGVESANLRLVWTPEWSIEMVTETGKDDLREFGLSV
nr:1,2-phenylacetyl-CoA epoxidase subunit PaaD [Halorussus amylolyticus]